jgi:hypothetical protein
MSGGEWQAAQGYYSLPQPDAVQTTDIDPLQFEIRGGH